MLLLPEAIPPTNPRVNLGTVKLDRVRKVADVAGRPEKNGEKNGEKNSEDRGGF